MPNIVGISMFKTRIYGRRLFLRDITEIRITRKEKCGFRYNLSFLFESKE